MKKIISLLIFGGLLLTACSSSEEAPGANDKALSDTPILLQVGDLEMTTRAGQEVQNKQFDRNQYLDIYIEEHLESGQYASTVYNNGSAMKYQTTDNRGTLRPSSSMFPYFPSNGRGVDIMGVYPSDASLSSFTVQNDQSYAQNDKYRKSDLMLSKHSNVARTKNAVALTFKHMLSKINITLTVPDGADVSILNNAKVTLTNVARTVNWDPTKSDEEGDEIISTTVGNTGSVVVTSDGSEKSSAIIVPQTFADGYFMKIELSNGDILNYYLAQTLTFKSGTKNNFTITVDEKQLRVKYAVEPWDDNSGNNITNDDVSL